MKNKVHFALRIFLGLIYFVFGLNGFLNFIPVPPMPEPMTTFMGALLNTGYFFPLLKGTEVICGALLLSGFFAPLALTILAPITLNILMVHLFVAQDGAPMGFVMLVIQIFLMYGYRDRYSALFKAK